MCTFLMNECWNESINHSITFVILISFFFLTPLYNDDTDDMRCIDIDIREVNIDTCRNYLFIYLRHNDMCHGCHVTHN